MELDFDKEIDAILRKRRDGGVAAVGVSAGTHLDADEIAAFAESALPEATKLFYTKHLADCDSCRTILSRTISLFNDAEPEAAFSGVKAANEPATAPWYRQMLAVPNLVYTMGALVLLFSGFLGYMVLQKTSESREGEVAQVSDSEKVSSASPASPFSANTANTNTVSAGRTMTDAQSNASANTASNSAVIAANPVGEPDAKTRGVSDAPQTSQDEDKVGAVGGAVQPIQPAASPPPSLPKDQPALERDEKKLAEKRKEEPVVTGAQTIDRESQKQGGDDLRMKSDAGLAASKSAKKPAYGPSRDRNDRANSMDSVNSANNEAPVSRRVSNKTFESKGGIWYDTAYHGQETKNVRRGTKDYLKLDGGLRSITDALYGTVVVVWKDKAYRIQ